MRHGDTVREVYGDRRSGVIIHIYRSFLFLHNKTQVENAGIIVVRTSNVDTVSAKGGRATGPDLTKMNPALMMNRGNASSMPPPQRGGRDRLLGKTVVMRKGPLKGLLGIVIDVNEDTARIELHTKKHPVGVPRDWLLVKEYVPLYCRSNLFIKLTLPSPITGQTIDVSRGKGPRTPFGSGAQPSAGRDPWQGGRTPMAAADSGRTPAWGASLSSRSKWPRVSSFFVPPF